jgi:dephospho-CoA kinase
VKKKSPPPARSTPKNVGAPKNVTPRKPDAGKPAETPAPSPRAIAAPKSPRAARKIAPSKAAAAVHPDSTRRAILGLLGGIASGKSTVSALLAADGRGLVFDADAVARECLDVTARDGRLVEALGPWAVAANGSADRKTIAKRVFDEPALLRALERLIHPAVLARIDDAIEDHRSRKGAPLLILDVPLLIETGLDRRCDALWFVDAPDEHRFARAKDRLGLTRDEVLKRESAQSPLDRKRTRADLVIRNDGSVADLEARVADGMRALGL